MDFLWHTRRQYFTSHRSGCKLGVECYQQQSTNKDLKGKPLGLGRNTITVSVNNEGNSSLKLTASLPLKMDGWGRRSGFLLGQKTYVQGVFAVCFRESNAVDG